MKTITKKEQIKAGKSRTGDVWQPQTSKPE
jgi:hypothetical protein